MSSLKTLGFSLILSVSLTGPSRAADAFLHHISTCVGRLSAQMEHQWLMSDAGAVQTAQQRAGMVDLLEAITTPQNARLVLSLRIGAKHAHASLLTRAVFSTDDPGADWAHDRARTDVAACKDLLLSPPMTREGPDRGALGARREEAGFQNSIWPRDP